VTHPGGASVTDLDLRVLPAAPGGMTIRKLVHYLQALEDAVDYRRARASAPCGDCDVAAGKRCEDHGRDIDLIGEYAETHRLIDEAIEAASATSARRAEGDSPQASGGQ
jgi:hypothetical protein